MSLNFIKCVHSFRFVYTYNNEKTAPQDGLVDTLLTVHVASLLDAMPVVLGVVSFLFWSGVASLEVSLQQVTESLDLSNLIVAENLSSSSVLCEMMKCLLL